MRPSLQDVRDFVQTRLESEPDGRVSRQAVKEVLQELFDFLEDLQLLVENRNGP